MILILSCFLLYANCIVAFQRYQRHRIHHLKWTDIEGLAFKRKCSESPISLDVASTPTSSLDSSDNDVLMKEVETILLPKLFGHSKFRPGQREVVSKVLAGESCLAVLPTGAGKSLLYMLPSQLLDGITIVVSPLLALMRDQVEALRKEGISAVRLDSSMTGEEIKAATAEIVSQRVKVLYVTPERFKNEKFRKMLASLKVAMFVVDEAHCISEWGHAFRPDYLRVSQFAAASNAKVRLALTATATQRVTQDILNRLGISAQNIVQLPSSRKNLLLSMKYFSYPNDGYSVKLNALLNSLPDLANGGSVIIYVNTILQAENLSIDLNLKGYNTKAYHSLIPNRVEVEEWFLMDKTVPGESSHIKSPIVVGTTAFGMGIDKSDVRSVVHFDQSRSVEDYVQGIGRAGRDGLEASCLSFLTDSDTASLRSQCRGGTPSREYFHAIVKRIFGPVSFPAKFDAAMYVNSGEISKMFDVTELQLTSSLSHLVQQNILVSLTPLYTTYKVGKINTGKLAALLGTLNSDSISATESPTEFVSGYDNNELSSQELIAQKKKSAALVVKLAKYIEDNGKRKWCSVNAISVGNDNKCPPGDIIACVGMMVSSSICESGGVSDIVNRYKVSKENVLNEKIGNSEIDEIASILYDHAAETQRRALQRINELVSLIKKGCDDNDGVWNNISEHFDQTADIENDKNSAANYPEYEILDLEFDEAAWVKIRELIVDKSIPTDDLHLIANFATGVNSPRLRQTKLSKHISFGVMRHCNWNDVLQKVSGFLRK